MSTLHVENLKGLSSGGNANKIIIPSGQTLDASEGFTPPAGMTLQTVHTSQDVDQTYSNYSSNTTASSYFISATITPKLSNSNILIQTFFQWSSWGTNSTGDFGFIMQRDAGTILGDSNNGYWVSGGGVDLSHSILEITGYGNPKYYVRTASKSDIDTNRSSGTSAITYGLKFRIGQSSGNEIVRVGRDGWGGSGYESQRSKTTIILTEIAA